MKYYINPKIKWRWENDKVLLNTLIGMNATAGQVLEFFKSTDDSEEVIQKMTETYPDADPARIRTDVEKIVQSFARWHLLLTEETRNLPHIPIPISYIESVKRYFNMELNSPVGVAIEVTLVCNANCPHCSVSSKKDLVLCEVPTEPWKRFIEELSRMNVFTLTFLGGEPLLRPDILELIALGAQKGMRTMITTNGYIVDRAVAEDLKKAGLVEVQISLDGARAATHDEFRQLPGLYDRTIEAAHHCLNEKLDVVLLTTIVKKNLREITDVMELTVELGIPRLNLMNLQKVGRAKKNPELEPSREEYVRLLAQVYEKDQELSGLFTFYPGLPAAMYHEAVGIKVYEELERQGKISSCLAGITHCTVSPVGDVKPCGLSEDISVGNVFREPFSKIWKEAPVFKHLRSYSKENWNPCSQCGFVKVCKTGCKALPQLVDDPAHWNNPDPICVECFATYGGKIRG